jgi:hypothetical protein
MKLFLGAAIVLPVLGRCSMAVIAFSLLISSNCLSIRFVLCA